MVDLHTANALAMIAAETGAGIAMVGDPLQARPVGHSGAMASMTRRATAVVELTAVHRFRDPDYAALTLRMREPASRDAARAVAAELDERGLIHQVSNELQAREVMVEAYFRWAARNHRIALVTGTNEEADAINEAIQQRRLERGHLSLGRIAVGQGEQRLLEGDVVQTRRNDRAADVENRALWTIHRITSTGLQLTSLGDSGDTRTVSHDYVAQHVHLAYASTVHGIQGETTDASVVGPGADASGLYVGMTRGRAHNEVIAIARTSAAAREQVAESLLRGIPEVSIDDSIRAAHAELGRAARTPDPLATAPGAGGNSGYALHGRVPHRSGLINANRQREAELRAELERLSDWIRTARRSLLQLDSRIAADDAGGHGRPGAASTAELADQHAELLARFEATSADYGSLTRTYRELTRSTGVADAERARGARSQRAQHLDAPIIDMSRSVSPGRAL